MIIKLTIPDLADSLVGSLENKVNELNSEVEQLNNDIDTLNNTVLEKENEISELKSKLLDWASLGYSDAPSYLIEDVNYSNSLTEDNIYNSFFENLKLVYVPNLDYSKFRSSIRMPNTVEFADIIDLRNIKLKNYANSLFYNCEKLKQVNTVYVDGIECSNLFCGCTSLNYVNVIGKPNRLANYMFYSCINITLLPELLDLSDVENVGEIFLNCTSLPEYLKVNYKLNKCTVLSNFFSNCYLIKEIDMTDMYIPIANDLSYLFSGCNNLKTVKFPKEPITLDTKIYCEGMFYNTGISNIDLSYFNNCKVSARKMFYDCSNLISADLTNVHLTKCDYLFYNCPNLQSIIGLNLTYGDGDTNGAFLGHNIVNIDITGIGCKDSSSYNKFIIHYASNLGVNSIEHPYAYNNLINSLAFFSFDRVSAGYQNPYYLFLHANTKALLEQDPNIIALITNKGFTIT